MQVTTITDHHKKTKTGIYYTGATRASELHLPSCHHRPNGEGIHVPVGYILQEEGRDVLRRLSPAFMADKGWECEKIEMEKQDKPPKLSKHAKAF